MNNRLINACIVALFVIVPSVAYLLDGPSELEAIQATADSKQDAIKSAASKAINTPARGQKDHKTTTAGLQP